MFFSSPQRKPSLVTLTLGLLAATLLIKGLGVYWIHQRFGHLKRQYSYVGSDYPETWPLRRKKVLMAFDTPKRFLLDAEDGIAEWASLVPEDGVVHLGPYKQPFTVSLFHELRCLNIIREELTRDVTGASGNGSEAGPGPLVRHCLNYVRQMVTCRGDLELESFQYASHINPIDQHGVYECKDWEAVYREVEKNQAEYRPVTIVGH